MPPSATASGADAGNNGGARSREHNQGNQERKYTAEQAAAVIRIRRCKATAFYEILDVQTSCTDGEIKKAYRKQSLLTHPDKNGHAQADEAFKMVARAFSVLGDKDKRDKFDRFGTDPDSRFASAQQQQNPFAGFARRNAAGGAAAGGGGGGGGGMWEDEISPEEMFQRFFGGGFGGPFGGFDTGPQFVFNLGGGPGVRVHQFGGARPRRRPREGEQAQETSLVSTIMGLMPILLLFIFPLLSSLFSGSSSQPAMPRMVFDAPEAPYTQGRTTKVNKVKYFINPRDFGPFKDNPNKLAQLDNYAEVTLTRTLRNECENEVRHKQHLHDDAQGWFFQDPDKMEVAKNFEMKSCRRLEKMGYTIR